MSSSTRVTRWAGWIPVAIVAGWLGHGIVRGVAAQVPPQTAPAPVAATLPATMPVELGPDVVVLKELENLYQPVPFSHRSHAKMAEMGQGCIVCHHRSPEATTQPADAPLANGGEKTQEASGKVPACKSCHPPGGADADVRMPNLKGAYHRQCLNCHKEWMHANSCNICHEPKQGTVAKATAPAPTPDDIMGRMHPPIPEPESKTYKTRFTPADGGNVLFRHKEHVGYFGLKCASCHHRDSCSNCHDANATELKQKPVAPARTWEESHGPCMSCHREDRCRHCHYKDDQPPPPAFAHARTGQLLDKDHETLSCERCHPKFRFKADKTCGGSACHAKNPAIAFPAERPGPLGPREADPRVPLRGPVRGVAR